MIFVTVGAMEPFDRLVSTVDDWAGAHGRTDVFAQIGPTDYVPRNMEWTHLLDPAAFRARVASADVIVAHAGMGSIITALEFAKPIVVLPRKAALKETRNDHQTATAKRFGEVGIYAAFDRDELIARLDDIASLAPPTQIEARASERLLHFLRDFVNA